MNSNSEYSQQDSHNEVKLHFMCGKIASGKSTLAKQLTQQKQAVLLIEDEWLAALYPDQIKQLSDYIEKSRLLKSVLENHIVALIKIGNTVVLDFPANTPTQRTWLNGIAQKANAVAHCHVLDVENEECKQRLAARNLSGENPFKTSEAEFDLITQHFSYPSAEEELSIEWHNLNS